VAWERDVDGRRVQVCAQCFDAATDAGESPAAAATRLAWDCAERWCAGAYACTACDRHWREAGYRQDLPHVIGGLSAAEIEAADYGD